MENQPEFDLDDGMRRWRQHFQQAEALTCEQAAELQAHLQDSIAALQAKGLTGEEAFLVASRRLGDRDMLDGEYRKMNPGAVWRWRALWMVAGILLFSIGMDVVRILFGLFTLSGTFLHLHGFALGWMGVGVRCAVVAGLLWGARWFLRANLERIDQWNARCAQSPVLAMVLLSVVVLGLQLVAAAIPPLLAREVGIGELGLIFLFDGWGATLISVVLTVVLIAIFVRWAGRREVNAIARHLLTLLAMSLLAFLTPGCGSETPNQSAQSEAKASKGKTTLPEQSLALWTSGDKDAAADKFLQFDWTKGKPFSTGAILSFSEPQFVALPQDARTKLSSEMMADLAALKQLCAYLKQQGQDAAAKGDQAKATKYFTAISQCGDRLDRPDSLLMVQLVGQGLKKLAVKEPGLGVSK